MKVKTKIISVVFVLFLALFGVGSGLTAQVAYAESFESEIEWRLTSASDGDVYVDAAGDRSGLREVQDYMVIIRVRDDGSRVEVNAWPTGAPHWEPFFDPPESPPVDEWTPVGVQEITATQYLGNSGYDSNCRCAYE